LARIFDSFIQEHGIEIYGISGAGLAEVLREAKR
jgi:hypothetical protein